MTVFKFHDFEPFPGIRSGSIQTLAGYLWPDSSLLSCQNEIIVPLSDGDRLVIIEDKPDGWQYSDRVSILVHGLTGHCQSKYMTRMTSKLLKEGHLVIRVNLRGCGPGFGYALQPYHCGRSLDIREIVHFIQNLYAASPISLMGFSLGGNIVLKMAGEEAVPKGSNLDSIIAISPPIHLSESLKHMQSANGKPFEKYFVRSLLRHVKRLHQEFPELPNIELNAIRSLEEFDNNYTAPRSGFRDAQDYYTKASSAELIPNINIPTLIIAAKDDPLIETNSISGLPKQDNVTVILTEKGGHLGFITKPNKNIGIRWMDTLILNWIKHLNHLQPNKVCVHL